MTGTTTNIPNSGTNAINNTGSSASPFTSKAAQFRRQALRLRLIAKNGRALPNTMSAGAYQVAAMAGMTSAVPSSSNGSLPSSCPAISSGRAPCCRLSSKAS